jgi:Glyoxalase-like domain
MNDIDNINHVGMVARNLGSTTVRYEAMGFQLTPYSPHSGAWKPGAPVQNFGSGNRCVMFANNYLEILGTEDPNQPTERLAGYLARHQGAHIVCFNTETTPRLDDRLRANGVPTSGVISLQRDIDTPDGVRTAKFERVQFSPDNSPEGYTRPPGTSPRNTFTSPGTSSIPTAARSCPRPSLPPMTSIRSLQNTGAISTRNRTCKTGCRASGCRWVRHSLLSRPGRQPSCLRAHCFRHCRRLSPYRSERAIWLRNASGSPGKRSRPTSARAGSSCRPRRRAAWW